MPAPAPQPQHPRRRVAVIATWYPTVANPGLGVFIREHARALARAADVVVVYPDPDEPSRGGLWQISDAVEEGLRTLRLHVRRPRDRGINVALRTVALRAALRRLRREGWIPDVLHAHVFSAGLLALAARPRGVPVVVTEHFSGLALGTLSGLDRRIASYVFSHANLVCPVSENLAGHVRNLAPTALIQVVPNAVDIDRFRPAAGDREPGPIQALLVAGLTEVKQVPVLLDALALAKERPGAPAIELTVAGDGPLLPQLRAHAARLGTTVRFLGRRDSAEVAELMRRSDLLVLPSRWENLPVVLLEALASGLPVVATSVGGVPEIVDGDAGVLVPPGDAHALADGLLAVAARLSTFDPAALHTRAVERYGFAAVTGRWLHLYDDLVARIGLPLTAAPPSTPPPPCA